MSWQQFAMWAVVVAVFAVSAFCGWKAKRFNVTAAALVAAWASAEIYCRAAETSLPLRFYVMADIAVVTVIYAKAIVRCGAKVYRGFWHQAKCMLTDLTPWDRWIVGLYVLCIWPAYVLNIDAYAKWNLLWAATMAQFYLAGVESLTIWRKSIPTSADPRTGGGLLRVALRGPGHAA